MGMIYMFALPQTLMCKESLQNFCVLHRDGQNIDDASLFHATTHDFSLNSLRRVRNISIKVNSEPRRTFSPVNSLRRVRPRLLYELRASVGRVWQLCLWYVRVSIAQVTACGKQPRFVYCGCKHIYYILNYWFFIHYL